MKKKIVFTALLLTMTTLLTPGSSAKSEPPDCPRPWCVVSSSL